MDLATALVLAALIVTFGPLVLIAAAIVLMYVFVGMVDAYHLIKGAIR